MSEEVAARIAEAYAALAEGDFRGGVQGLQTIAHEHPDSHPALHACGTVLAHLGQPVMAEPYLRRAVALDPASVESKVALGLVLLAQEKYAEGWSYYEARDGLPGDDWATTSMPYPEWKGEPLEGRRLLVWFDEGFGDQIQFIRFVEAVKARGGEPVVCCAFGLERLFANSLDAFVTPVTLQVQHPVCDLWTRMSLLPARLGLGPREARQPPYLFPIETRHIPGARIGVATRGNPNMAADRHRSLWPELGERLARLPGAISLLPEDTGAKDFEDTAEIIAGLDLVISVDTSIAHLAGAMGKPVWILVPTIGRDWRWGLSGETTPWYPTARLFRQPRMNDWQGAVEAVERALAER